MTDVQLIQQKTSSTFCHSQTVGHQGKSAPPSTNQEQPEQQQQPPGKKVFCFYDIQDDFRPQDLNPCLCTHVVYSYVAVRKNLSFIAGKKGKHSSVSPKPFG